MKLFLLLLLSATSLIQAATQEKNAAPNACTAPGDPMHWRVSACLYQAETDDLESPEVQKCVSDSPRPKKGLSPCAVKAYYKKAICSKLYGPDTTKVNQCINDASFIPRHIQEMQES